MINYISPENALLMNLPITNITEVYIVMIEKPIVTVEYLSDRAKNESP